jgi:hypothetical protein
MSLKGFWSIIKYSFMLAFFLTVSILPLDTCQELYISVQCAITLVYFVAVQHEFRWENYAVNIILNTSIGVVADS